MIRKITFCALALALGAAFNPAQAGHRAAIATDGELDAMIKRHAAAEGVPEDLVRRVIKRESRGNPRVVSRGNYGLMQIKPATARGVGYAGNAAGLLDPETNMTYAVKYLAGAWRVAGGNRDLAVHYYAAGYYYAAKSRGLAPTPVTKTANVVASVSIADAGVSAALVH